MGAYFWWMMIGMLALVGFVLLLVVPGLALVVLGAVLIGALALVVSAIARAGGHESDTEERRDEFDARHRAR